MAIISKAKSILTRHKLMVIGFLLILGIALIFCDHFFLENRVITAIGETCGSALFVATPNVSTGLLIALALLAFFHAFQAMTGGGTVKVLLILYFIFLGQNFKLCNYILRAFRKGILQPQIYNTNII